MTALSDFVRHAAPEHKAEVYGKAMDAACERQLCVMRQTATVALITQAEDMAALSSAPVADMLRRLAARLEEQRREIASMHQCFDTADMERAALRGELELARGERDALREDHAIAMDALRYVVRVYVVDDDAWDKDAVTNWRSMTFINEAAALRAKAKA